MEIMAFQETYPPFLLLGHAQKTAKCRIDAGAAASKRHVEICKTFFAMPCRWRSAPEHQSRLRRKTIFDGARRGLAVGLVNKFPVRLQRPAVVLRTFRLAGHQTPTKGHET